MLHRLRVRPVMATVPFQVPEKRLRSSARGAGLGGAPAARAPGSASATAGVAAGPGGSGCQWPPPAAGSRHRGPAHPAPAVASPAPATTEPPASSFGLAGGAVTLSWQACPGHPQQHGRQDRKRQPARPRSAASGRRGRPEDGARRRLRRSESRLRPRQPAHDRTRTVAFEADRSHQVEASPAGGPWYHHQREKSASASGSSEAAGHRQNKPSSSGLVFAQPSASDP
jgi:hypothetical protein